MSLDTFFPAILQGPPVCDPEKCPKMNPKQTRTVKRYSNRKLYDTDRSRYVTLDEIASMIKDGEDVQIVDNKTKDDLTSVTLAQILFAEEKKKKHVLPLSALRRIIQNGGDFFFESITAPIHTLRDTTEKRLETLLMEAGERTEDVKSSFRELMDSTNKNIEEMQERLEESIRTISNKMVFSPHQKELRELRERIVQLESRLKDVAA